MEREPEERQVLVVRRERRQPLERVPEVVAEEADEPAEERRRVRPATSGVRSSRADQAAGDRERVAARRPATRGPRPDRRSGTSSGRSGRAGRSRAGRGRAGRGSASAASIGRDGRELGQRLEADARPRAWRTAGAVPARGTVARGVGSPRDDRRPTAADAGRGRRHRVRATGPRDRHRAGPARAAQRDHRRRRRPRRPRDDHPRRRSARRRRGAGPDRRDGRSCPHDGDVFTEPVFAGCHRLNGNGELTGLEWIREAGLLTGPIGITNTHSVGVVHDAIIRHAVRRAAVRRRRSGRCRSSARRGTGCSTTSTASTSRWTTSTRRSAAAAGGPVAEGNVGGGTGMVCHEFKGGIGTASRVVDEADGGWTVGVLVQANYGRRELAPRRRRPGRRGDPGRRRSRARTPGGRRRAAGGRAAGRRPARARSSSSSRPTRRSCPTSASGSPSGPASGSPGWAAPAATRAATCSSASRPATAACRTRRSPRDPRLAVDVRSVNDHVIGALFDGGHRGDRGGDPQRAGRRRDDDRPRRHHRPRPAARPAASRSMAATAAGRRRMPADVTQAGRRSGPPTVDDLERDPRRSSRRTATTGRPGRRHSSRRVPPLPASPARTGTVVVAEAGDRLVGVRRVDRHRAGPSTSPTCSSARTGSARGSAGRLLEPRLPRRPAADDVRVGRPAGDAALRPSRDDAAVAEPLPRRHEPDRLPSAGRRRMSADAEPAEVAELELDVDRRRPVGRLTGSGPSGPATPVRRPRGGGPPGRRRRRRGRQDPWLRALAPPTHRPAPATDPVRRSLAALRRVGRRGRGRSVPASWARTRRCGRCSSSAASGSSTATRTWPASRISSIRLASCPTRGCCEPVAVPWLAPRLGPWRGRTAARPSPAVARHLPARSALGEGFEPPVHLACTQSGFHRNVTRIKVHGHAARRGTARRPSPMSACGICDDGPVARCGRRGADRGASRAGRACGGGTGRALPATACRESGAAETAPAALGRPGPRPASRSARRPGCPTRSSCRRSCGRGCSRAARGGRTSVWLERSPIRQ